MPFAATSVLLTMSGTLFTTERFSIGLRSTLAGGVDYDSPIPVADLNAIRDVITSWWGGSGSIIANSAALTTIKVNRIGTDGRYTEQFTNRVDLASPVPGVAAARYPAQVSLVASLETGNARGAAHRGRMFLPSPVPALGADGRIPAADATAAATKVAALITALNAVPAYGLTQVMSFGTKSDPDGAQNPVTGVTVGRVLDTMRSRRTSLLEERSAPAVVQPGGS